MTSPIKPLWDEMPLQFSTRLEQPKTGGGIENPFTNIFRSAINAVKETDADKTQTEYLMATGQLDNPALLTIASAKADTAVELLIQLRSQAMNAYNELMRISL